VRKIALKLAVAAGILVAGLAAAHAATTVVPKRPAGVPMNYVITPFGYFDPTCVVHLAEGDELRPDDKLIRHANKSVSAMHKCDYPHYRADGEKVLGDEKAAKTPNISHAWVEYASTTTSSSFGYLYAEWTVPPTPTSNDGQTLYFFPGMEDYSDVVTIIQPVLGWNSDYASAWGIASWNCCVSGTTYEAPPQPVSSGDNILGYMFDNCAAGTKTCSSWDIVTWDLENGKFSQLIDTSNFGQTFNWAFAGAVEVYNIAQCSDYPSNGGYPGSHSISFNQIGLYNNKNQQITTPAWSVTNSSGGLTPQCSYGGSIPKQIVLNY
jgi:hypothetical protein